MKKILVAVDGSDCSLKAVSLAAEIGRLADVPLRVVHVVAESPHVPLAYQSTVAKIAAEARRHSEEIVQHAAKTAEAAGARCERISLTGHVAEAICKEAENPEVWMVVVGSHGRKAPARWLLGSVADRVAHLCPKPVLVAR